MIKKSFYSHGKLLLTAEYLILDGTKGLALPTKKGQWLMVEENESNGIHWRSLDKEGYCWFEAHLIANETEIQSANETDKEDPILNKLLKILNAARALNPNFLINSKGYLIETKLEFHRQWGLGSSSTLINNIAQWAKINPFSLLENSMGGSGYDIACAQHDTPILYIRNGENPSISEIEFDPIFRDHLFFVYLNKKQDSAESIKHYQSLPLKSYDQAETEVNQITEAILDCSDLNDFEDLLSRHEEIISDCIKTPTIKSRLFENYQGTIKSLGGWGGDFVLVTGNNEDMKYFRDKGYTTIIPFDEMIV